MSQLIKKYSLLFIAGCLLAIPVSSHAQKTALPTKDIKPGQCENEMTSQDRQMLQWAQELAARASEVMEKWIDGGKITKEKLFSALYYPIANTDPQKFKTDYDELFEKDIVPIQEEIFAKSSTIRFSLVVDRNGYVPAHNRRYSQPLTGNKHVDLNNNRTKRIFIDKVGYSAGKNTAPYLIQVYKRDTGETMKDISVPVMVKGKHFGGLRFGYIPQ